MVRSLVDSLAFQIDRFNGHQSSSLWHVILVSLIFCIWKERSSSGMELSVVNLKSFIG